MKSVREMPGHLMVFSQTAWDEGLSPEQMQQVMRKFIVWHDALLASGQIAGGFPLLPDRTRISGTASGQSVLDGPFPETKETIGGYLELKTDDPDTALAIARSNPLLDIGVTIELRRPAGECPVFLRVMEALAAAELEVPQPALA